MVCGGDLRPKSKTSNYSTARARQVIWGLSASQWAGSELPPPIEYENNTGADLPEGTVITLDASGEIALTSVVGLVGPVGVLVDDIGDGETGAVAWSGPIDLVLVVSAVTAGHYGETSATPGEARDTGSADPDIGSFVLFTSSGTSPSGFLLGAGVAGSVNQGGDMVPYYIPLGEKFTVPVYRQALYAHSITLDGALIVNGILLPVN